MVTTPKKPVTANTAPMSPAFFLIRCKQSIFRRVTMMKLTAKTLLTIATTLIAIATTNPEHAKSQTFRINHNGKTGHGFKTTVGTITALHVGGLQFDHTFPQMDIGISTAEKHDDGFKTSDLPPAYFIDRRGTRHTLVSTGKKELQTIVSIRFFHGESGMPIFAKDGTVCGVVLGNVLIGRRWQGRMSRVTPIIEAALDTND